MAAEEGLRASQVASLLLASRLDGGYSRSAAVLGLHIVEVEHSSRAQGRKSAGEQRFPCMGQDDEDAIKVPVQRRQHLSHVSCIKPDPISAAIGLIVPHGQVVGGRVFFDADDFAGVTVTGDDQREGAGARAEDRDGLAGANHGGDARSFLG